MADKNKFKPRSGWDVWKEGLLTDLKNTKDVLVAAHKGAGALSPANFVPFADPALRTLGGEEVQPWEWGLDALGSVGDGIKYLGAMGPIVATWGKGVKQGERIGKNARNIEKAVEKSENPVKVRFHRTMQDNAPSINEKGLIIDSKNYGANSPTYSKRMIWTADNPDEIPVLNTKVKSSDIRNDPKVATFRIEIPNDKYYSMKRYKRKGYDNFEDAGLGESMSTDRGGGVRSGVDLFGEPISPQYLTEMEKREPLTRKESNFLDSIMDKFELNAWGVTRRNEDRFKQMDKLPKELRNSFEEAIHNRDARALKELIPQVETYLKPVMNGEFDWRRFNKHLEKGETPYMAAGWATPSVSPFWNNLDYDTALFPKFNKGAMSRVYGDDTYHNPFTRMYDYARDRVTDDIPVGVRDLVRESPYSSFTRQNNKDPLALVPSDARDKILKVYDIVNRKKRDSLKSAADESRIYRRKLDKQYKKHYINPDDDLDALYANKESFYENKWKSRLPKYFSFDDAEKLMSQAVTLDDVNGIYDGLIHKFGRRMEQNEKDILGEMADEHPLRKKAIEEKMKELNALDEGDLLTKIFNP